MRALLTGGIKAILAIAALSTAAHWAMRVQREAPSSAPQTASIPDPVSTGSIERRQTERQAERPLAAASAPASASAGLDQTHLAALVAGAVAAKPKAPRIAAGPDKAAAGPSKGGPGPAKPASGPAKVLASADKVAVRR